MVSNTSNVGSKTQNQVYSITRSKQSKSGTDRYLVLLGSMRRIITVIVHDCGLKFALGMLAASLPNLCHVQL